MLTKKYRAHNALAFLDACICDEGITAKGLAEFFGTDEALALYVMRCAHESRRIILCRDLRLRGSNARALRAAVQKAQLEALAKEAKDYVKH